MALADFLIDVLTELGLPTGKLAIAFHIDLSFMNFLHPLDKLSLVSYANGGTDPLSVHRRGDVQKGEMFRGSFGTWGANVRSPMAELSTTLFNSQNHDKYSEPVDIRYSVCCTT